MFENLLFQDQVVLSLREDMGRSCLPRSLLFSGPACSGKTTAALELARALSCEKDAGWACPCPACERHRRLVHPDLLLTGSDDLGLEIAASLGMLERSQSKRELYAFLRSIRRLTRRFDPELWAGEESKFSKAAASVLSIEEILSDLDPGSPKADPLAAAKKAAAEAEKLLPLLPQSLPIFQVRNASAWARLTPSGKRKCLVIENADTMLDASRNALLKLLEEPPASLTIILTTARKSAIIETILSRLREVPFRQRSPKEDALVMSRVFALPETPFGSLGEYLDSFSGFPQEASREAARLFLSGALCRAREGGKTIDPVLAKAFPHESGEIKLPVAALERRGFASLLRSMQDELSRALGDPGSGLDLVASVERWARLIRDAAARSSSYNQSPELLSRALMNDMGNNL
jgi:DNA polymerase-3 subunit gamma/tau